MSRKKHKPHVNHERWLVSYADFITLLFAFFVVLFASSQSDRKKQSQLAAAMQAAFITKNIFEPHSKTPSLTPSSGSSINSRPVPIQPPLPTAEDPIVQPAQETARQIEAQISKLLQDKTIGAHIPRGSVNVSLTDQGIVISLHEAGFFSSASAEVNPSSVPFLERLATTLHPGPLRVEGHTDNVPIHTTQFPTNWELSTARSTTIARLLLEHSTIHPANLSASGYAEFHPIASNATEAGRARNRRVDIILLRSPTPSR
ncbi:flagellar motor protein MotB [Granulicella sp. dw_53]|uniref:flagellar motor protein MotB n=1 Tax=Granulicella sp. dw_53 TaxID=2719792 RepID=UPI001BD3B42D|nr:flagellar motor protein MotB [Granulicella sp. dw_53]